MIDLPARAAYFSAGSAHGPRTDADPLPVESLLRWLFATVAICAMLIWFVDRPAALIVGSWEHDTRRAIAAFSQIGYGWLIAPALVAGWLVARFAFRSRAWECRVLFIIAAFAASTVVQNVLKILFGRSRPRLFHRDGTFEFDLFRLEAAWRSFPSGHAMNIMTIAVCLAIIFPRQRLPVLVGGAVIAMARIGAGAHYPSDIVVGAYVAAACAIVVAWLFERRGVRLTVS